MPLLDASAAEVALEAARDSDGFAAVVERLPDPVLLVTGRDALDLADRRITFANVAARELLIQHALVLGELPGQQRFLQHNQAMLARTDEEGHYQFRLPSGFTKLYVAEEGRSGGLGSLQIPDDVATYNPPDILVRKRSR